MGRNRGKRERREREKGEKEGRGIDERHRSIDGGQKAKGKDLGGETEGRNRGGK